MPYFLFFFLEVQFIHKHTYLALNAPCVLLSTFFFSMRYRSFISVHLFLLLHLFPFPLILAWGKDFFPPFSSMLWHANAIFSNAYFQHKILEKKKKAFFTNTFICYFEFLWFVTLSSSFSADSVQMSSKNILYMLGNDNFGFQSFKLKLMLKISRLNSCDKQVIFNNIRQFLSVENYFSLISNQPSLL